MLSHLTNPHEILEAILSRLDPGGHLHTNFGVMDFKGSEVGVHQHLKRIDLAGFEAILEKHRMVPAGTFLYHKLREDR